MLQFQMIDEKRVSIASPTDCSRAGPTSIWNISIIFHIKVGGGIREWLKCFEFMTCVFFAKLPSYKRVALSI